MPSCSHRRRRGTEKAPAEAETYSPPDRIVAASPLCRCVLSLYLKAEADGRGLGDARDVSGSPSMAALLLHRSEPPLRAKTRPCLHFKQCVSIEFRPTLDVAETAFQDYDGASATSGIITID